MKFEEQLKLILPMPSCEKPIVAMNNGKVPCSADMQRWMCYQVIENIK